MVRSVAQQRVSNHRQHVRPILRDGASRLLRMRVEIELPPLPVIGVDLDVLPDAVLLVGIAVGEGVDRVAVVRLDDEQRADRRLAVVRHHRPGGDDVHLVLAGLVEMDAVVAVMLGARVDRVFLVHGVNHKKHGGAPER